MNSINLSKFDDKRREELFNCELKIKNWLKFKSDYKALEERLLTITDKTTHDIMVPIGGSALAFMPGFIKHTNEILVLLGDNYFVERSAKQAIDIVRRRLTNCEQMIENLHKEKAQLENWLSFSEQFSVENQNLVEIVEEYDEQKEKLWREQHKQKVREYKQRLAQQKSLNHQLSDDSELNQKLETLEIEEHEPQEKEFKSILKKDNKSEENAKKEKSVSFNESEELIAKTECYSSPKLDENMITPDVESEQNSVALKSEVTERVVDSTTAPTANVENPTRIVSRFKASRLKK